MKAVFFDVDFTLIYPGPTFQGEGYQRFCEGHGVVVDPAAFEAAVASAAPILDDREDPAYDAEVFVAYTRHIIERMGGKGPGVDDCAREIYTEWAGCHHFHLYDDVRDVLRGLVSDGVRIGVISNSHRSLASFASHFGLEGLITAAVSSSEHGYMKPHVSIFRAALDQVGVDAADALMVGDNVRQDIEGALGVGMRAALLHRGDTPHRQWEHLAAVGVPVLRSMRDVATLVSEQG